MIKRGGFRFFLLTEQAFTVPTTVVNNLFIYRLGKTDPLFVFIYGQIIDIRFLHNRSLMNTGIPDRIIELITRNIIGEISAAEKAELDQWVDSSEQNRLFFSQINNRSDLKAKWQDYNEPDENQAWRKLAGDIPEINMAIAARPRVFNWRSFTIAAAVISIVSVAGWYFLTKNTTRKPEEKAPVASTRTDVEPGGNKAVLTLADGTRIVLDNAENGSLARQGSTAILKQQDLVTYKQGESAPANEVLYNTISTPRAGQYHVILPDGSNVWLNAASSIHFPTQFTGKDRKVDISGEAYFEVTKDKTRPFKVAILPGSRANKPVEIEVLGTHFNVNAYIDENYFNTTLLEGSIRLTLGESAGISKMLTPGEQALFNKEADKLSVTKSEDAQSSISWVKGIFHFEQSDIKAVMRQLSRWYNVDIVYEGKVSEEKITGDAERNIPLSKMLDRLEKMTSVHFSLQGQTVKVIQ